MKIKSYEKFSYHSLKGINRSVAGHEVSKGLTLGWPHIFFMNEGQKISFGPPFEVFLNSIRKIIFENIYSNLLFLPRL
jgi:hypothetical protein